MNNSTKMLGKAASIIRPKTGDKCSAASSTPSKPPMLMILWGSVFAGVLAWLTVTVMKLQRQLMVLEGLLVTKRPGDNTKRPMGGRPPPPPPNQGNPLEGAIGQLFGRRAPPPSRKPPPKQVPPKQPVRRMPPPPPQPAPMPPQQSLDEIDEEDEINSDDERVQELPPKMDPLQEEDEEDEEVPS